MRRSSIAAMVWATSFPPSTRELPMQMSLRGLMLFTAVLSLLCVVLFVAPGQWGAGIMAAISHFIVPPALLTGLIYSRGAVRAFFLGAVLSVGLPTSLAAVYVMIGAASGGVGEIAQYVKFFYAMLWATGIASGLIGAAIYRFVAPASPDDAPLAAAQEPKESPCDA